MDTFVGDDDFSSLLYCLSITLVIAAISGAFSASNVLWFMSLLQSKLCPSRQTFRYMWTMSYITMGISSSIIYSLVQDIYATPMILYFLQLLFNFAYCPIFFGLKRLDIALVDIVILDLIIAICTFNFLQISTLGGLLMLPYFGWTLFSTALNADFYRLQLGQKRDPVFFTTNYSPHHLYQSTLTAKNAKENEKNNTFYSSIPNPPKELTNNPPSKIQPLSHLDNSDSLRYRFNDTPDGLYVQ